MLHQYKIDEWVWVLNALLSDRLGLAQRYVPRHSESMEMEVMVKDGSAGENKYM